MEQRNGKRSERQLRWLHSASRLLLQGRCQGQIGSGVVARRWAQRRNIALKLMSQTPEGWNVPPASGESFWRALRFGGSGFALAWLLAQV